MFNLIYKELRLSAHPSSYIYMLLGALVLVPSYPYGMVFFFGCLSPYMTLMYGRETNDIFYTAMLPLKKRDTVKAKCLLIALVQLMQLLISLPFAVLRVHILPAGNPAGIEANVAFYGFGLLVYALFNVIFLTQFFKTAYKAGKAFVQAVIPAGLIIILMEVLSHLPGLSWIDSTLPADMLRQLPILLAGVLAYVLGMVVAYRVASKRFEKVDL
ncbi:ABC-2 transporter permease [Clostridia bacterium OttesenSCG-928-F22]|nr:ABC-2 transporter permease [Clostridia bacterium OttesenSCG-928-F22]